jgi:hypothetical protein
MSYVEKLLAESDGIFRETSQVIFYLMSLKEKGP